MLLCGVLIVAQQKQIRSMRMWVRYLASLSGLMIWHYCELWCRSQTSLKSRIAAAVARNCSSDSTLSLGTYIYHRYSPKKTKKKKKKKRNDAEKINVAPASPHKYVGVFPVFEATSIQLRFRNLLKSYKAHFY